MSALEILKSKKNRIILIQKEVEFPNISYRTALNGILVQEKNNLTDTKEGLKNVTSRVAN